MWIQTDTSLLSEFDIKTVDLSTIQDQRVTITTFDDEEHVLTGFRAIEAVFMIKPGAFEGNPYLKWKKNAWAYHNLIVHPIMQIMVWLGMKKNAILFHDRQSPKPIGYRL